MERRRLRPDPNDRSATHQEPTGRRHAREYADRGIDGNDAAAFGQESRPRDDVEPELTGFDAPPEDADIGDAGNGASRHGADLTGLEYDADNHDHLTSLEADSSNAEDILPDQIQRGVSEEEDEEQERNITARPREDLRPIQPDLFPDG